MKKFILNFFVIFFAMFFVFGCGITTNDDTYSGSITDLSRQYLSKGYTFTVYRSSTPLSDSYLDIGKGYVKMTFQILVDHYSTIDFNSTNQYISKQIVSNIKVNNSPQMGIVGDIYGYFDMYGTSSVKMVGDVTKYEKTFAQPVMYGEQSSIAIELDNIAYFDSANYSTYATTSEIYSDLGITSASVALNISFRIEFLTVEGKTIYRDYEISLPPSNFDIGGSEYGIDNTTDDVNEMLPYYEKD